MSRVPRHSKKSLVSIVIPAYNEENNIFPLYKKLCSIFHKKYDYEIIFVDDGSSDKSLAKIKNLASRDKRIKYLSFSKNFGHQNALRAGLQYAKGDCVISLDADLQHPPELIPEMLRFWERGYELALSLRRYERAVGFFKKYSAVFFCKILAFLSDIPIQVGTADFRLLDRKVVDIVCSMQEYDLYFRAMVEILGFKKCYIPYKVQKRRSGQTKYSFKLLLAEALSGITSFSIKPLRFALLGAGLCFLAAFFYALYALYIYAFTDLALTGWTSLILTLLFIGGAQMLLLGIIGEYLGRLFIESKKRPPYIIRESKL